MNLREFLSFRDLCPICDEKLTISFHSGRKQKLRYEDDRLLVLFDLNRLKKKHIDYKVGYSFGLKDGSFHIEFYTKDEKRFDNDSPIFLIERFKELDRNLKGYCVYKTCSMCRCYWYQSNKIELNYKKSQTGDIQIEREYFGMHQPVVDHVHCRVIKLLNHNVTEESFLSCFMGVPKDAIADYSVPHNATIMTLPLIQFVSKEETFDRIKKLLLFS